MGFLTGTRAQDGNDTIFQTSTIDALMQGVYVGNLTFGELKRHGDFGLGTLNDLDGEMMALDGVFYQVRTDGKAYVVPDDAVTPFAVVTFFELDEELKPDKPLGCREIESYLESKFPSKNIFYAIRIEGKLEHMKTRSVPKQSRPFPPLTEVVKNETIFEFEDVKGTIVGYWLPGYMADINATGFHFHFITEDKKAGGHVLDCKTDRVTIGLDFSEGLQMSLPETGDFLKADLTGTGKQQVNEVENEKKQ